VKTQVALFNRHFQRNLLESKALIQPNEDDRSWLPPMERPIVETIPTFIGYSSISDPSDQTKVYRDWKKSRRADIVYGSTFWKISVMHTKDRVLKLSDDNIQDLIKFGKKIASDDDFRPFQITLEYKGRPSLIVVKNDPG
jgi:hypothetical protein